MAAKYIFLVSRAEGAEGGAAGSVCAGAGYDEYYSFVVVHDSEANARGVWEVDESWPDPLDSLIVKCLGLADPSLEVGEVICSSFDAG